MSSLTMLLIGLVVTTASPAPAQEAAGEVALPEGTAREINEGSLYAGPYEVTREGDLIYGGDVRLECKDLVRFGPPRRPEPRSRPSAVQRWSY